MMHNTPISKALAITMLLVVVAVFYLILILPLQKQYSDNKQELAHLNRQLESYTRIANSRAEIEKLFQTMRPDDDTLSYYLKGSTQALASAELQAYVRSIIESSDGNLVSTQPMTRAEREPERMVKVNVRMTGTIESLVQVLFRVANGVPVLLTDDVMVRRNKAPQSRAEKTGHEERLEIHFTLTGFVRESVS